MSIAETENAADFEDADRGFVAALEPGVVKDASGSMVWDSDAFAYLRRTHRPTRSPAACGVRAPCARGRACSRSPRASTRSGAWTCRT
ncbi:hypothetical protein JCM13580A_62310 [Streptomyces drozdowiczii]